MLDEGLYLLVMGNGVFLPLICLFSLPDPSSQ